MKKLEEYIRSIPDFPEKGIIFRDITTILQDAEGLKLAIDSMIETLKDVDFDVIDGIPWIYFWCTDCLRNGQTICAMP